MVMAWAWSCTLPGCTTDDDDVDLPDSDPVTSIMEAIAGLGGVAVFFDVEPAGGHTLVAIHGYEDTRIVDIAAGSVTVDPDGIAGIRYQLLEGGEVVLEADAVEAGGSALLAPEPALLLADEALTGVLTLEPVDSSLAVGDVVVRRQIRGSDQLLFLDPLCLEQDALEASCWLDEPLALLEHADRATVDLLEAVTLPPHSPQVGAPTAEEIGLAWRFADGDGAEVYAGGSGLAIFTGLSLRYGDLHGHSNLSHDGCEHVDSYCGPREGGPGADYFANAVDAGLDFAAITDHAEFDELVIDGSEPWFIWEESQRLVEEADAALGPGFVPLLGYEWTASTPEAELLPEDDPNDYPEEFVAGHKTVVFADTTACDRYRIASDFPSDNFYRDLQHYGPGEPHYIAGSTSDLYGQFGAAAEECEAQEVLTFYHHPAVYRPVPVNWALESNVPQENYEMLVEIVGGHASAECRDTSLDGCDFLATGLDSNTYIQWGSVQEALTLGYRLGFLGGGDRHDGRPGALGPEPSYMGYLDDQDGDGIPETPRQMFTNGAITGVYIDGELGRERLWAGLTSRKTLATTGPRGPVVVLAESASGALYAPGAIVPATEFPLQLTVRTVAEADYELALIEVVEPTDGAVLASTDEESLVVELGEAEAPAVYVRLRYFEGDVEHRVFVSPLFIEE